jgi:tRNA(Ile2) C34 agmatinyltransferase TiaS
VHVDLLIAIDDTDNLEPDCVGTGRLARMLATYLAERGVCKRANVTRHQHFVHADIPFTSHNSSACLLAEKVTASREEVAELARQFLADHPNAGANPGLVVIEPSAVPGWLLDFAKRTQTEVVTLAEADQVAARLDGFVWSAGETGQGRIGALAAVALRGSGEDGRFIGLRGIRGLEGAMSVAEIVANSSVERVESLDGTELAPDTRIHTQDWVRPALRGGVPVMRVQLRDGRWIPEDKWRTYR